MVSTGKRLPYVCNKMSSSDEESSEEFDYKYQNENIVCGETDSTNRGRKPRCLSKNAQMARENRLRKKLYVNKLEKEVMALRNDNKKLNSILKNQSSIIKELKQEKKYLSSVIANSADIKSLIRNIHTSTDDLFHINSPTLSLEDHTYTAQDVNESDDAGVCLHVSKHRVSLEFCSKCSEKAGKSWSQL
ncbi:CREB/ATF bZIP transcription factor isoform X2 [Diabrotica virgifera virgifera]|uniref:CREB/ATF bZIP transcription factor-like isoform X2 n=1 Tax=Diabrotica virgifera virgifera TaxID=50390 RepID=A0A6P7GUE0_DIAVI|nr:CREB/ATF bZIP transcription factor isoform X2 [Diabrotica virgifera virgifera]